MGRRNTCSIGSRRLPVYDMLNKDERAARLYPSMLRPEYAGGNE